MKVYWAKESPPNQPSRTHPWTKTDYDGNGEYYDFISKPELIETSLEDYIIWKEYEAVQSFYRLLYFLNVQNTVFETNDCKLNVENNPDVNINKKKMASGRVMIFFRKLELNLLTAMVDSLVVGIFEAIKKIDPLFDNGKIELARLPAFFTQAKVQDFLRDGYLISFYFWAWGDTIEETMSNLNRVFKNLNDVMRELSIIYMRFNNLSVETHLNL